MLIWNKIDNSEYQAGGLGGFYKLLAAEPRGFIAWYHDPEGVTQVVGGADDLGGAKKIAQDHHLNRGGRR